MITLLSGLAAGAAHVVTGPDHLAALAPIAADQPRKAAAVGLRWGFGHGVGVILLGGLGVFTRASIDVQAISAWAEFFVGALLLAVGGWAFYRASQIVVHSHPHIHQDADHAHTDGDHAHFHVHASDSNHDNSQAHKGHSHAAFMVGLLHGAAGTGHLFGVLPSLALPPQQALVYLSAYFVAAVAAMAGFGALMGVVTRDRGPEVLRRAMYCTSSAAVFLGAFWMVQAWPVG